MTISILICRTSNGGCGFVSMSEDFKSFGEDTAICPICTKDVTVGYTRDPGRFNQEERELAEAIIANPADRVEIRRQIETRNRQHAEECEMQIEAPCKPD